MDDVLSSLEQTMSRKPFDPSYGIQDKRDNLGVTLERLRLEIEILRDSISIRSKEKEDRLYETIENTNASRFKERRKVDKSKYLNLINERGLYQLRYLFDPDTHKCIRFFWICAVLCVTAAFVFQTHNRIFTFLQKSTHDYSKTIQVSSYQFPAVTVCNSNQYRLSFAVQNGYYSLLTAHARGHTGTHNGKAPTFNGTLREFLQKAAHQKRDFITSCQFAGVSCDPSDFHLTFTDYGVCYTFRSRQSPILTNSGIMNSLSLIINVEEYEYISDFNRPVGVKVLVHGGNSSPDNIAGKAITVGTGLHTFMSAKKLTSVSCDEQTDEFSTKRETCYNNCNKEISYRRCGCLLAHHVTADISEYCSIENYIRCANIQKGYKKLSCNCGSNCKEVTYDVSLSHAATSVYAAENMVRTLRQKSDIKNRLRLARDMQQRSNPDILQYDIQRLNSLVRLFGWNRNNVSLYLSKWEDFRTACVKELEIIKQSVFSRNKTLSEYFPNLDNTDLLNFASAVNHFRSIIDEISTKAYVASTFSKSTKALNSTAQEILSKIGSIIKKSEDFFTSSSSMMSEIISAIIKFRNDIFSGYGKYFRQFVKSQAFYRNTTSALLSLFRVSSVELNRFHDSIYQLTSSPIINEGEYREGLLRMLKTVETFTYRTSQDVRHLFDQLKQTYNSHSQSIKFSVESLRNISINFQTYYLAINSGMTSVHIFLRDIGAKIRSIERELVDTSEAFQNFKITKSQLSIKFNEKSLQIHLKLLQDHLVNFNSIENLETVGNILFSGLKPLQLMNNKNGVIDLEWLQFKDLKQNAVSIIRDTKAHNWLFNEYISELKDYAQGNEIDREYFINNFLHLQIYQESMTETIVERRQGYGVIDLLCDIGGSLALYLGICALTVFETLHFILSVCFTRLKPS